MRFVRALPSAALLVAVFVGCDLLVRRWHVPLPAGVVGAIVVAAALFAGIVPLRWVERGADLLLEWLGLFFVPAGVGILRHVGVLRRDLFGVATVIVVSTAVTLAVTALIAERRAR